MDCLQVIFFVTSTFADFTVDRNIGYIGSEFEFTDTSLGNITDYSWDFGDGSTSDDQNPKHSYEAPGTFTVTLSINGNSFSKESTVTVLPNRTSIYSPAQGGDFESNLTDFIAENIAGTPFELGSSSVEGKDGTFSGSNAWVTGLNDQLYADNSQAFLYTPHFDFNETGTYEISFYTNYQFEDNWDGFIVEYTLDSGNTWTKLGDAVETGWYNQISDPQAIWGANVPIFSGDTGGDYAQMSKDVSSLAGNPRVGFRFWFGTDANTVEQGMAIDDFELTGPQTNAVADFTSVPSGGTCVGETITFHDNSTGSISAYNWDFGTGADPATATGAGPHTVTYTTAGSIDVSLTVTGVLNGDVTETKVGYLTITEGLSVSNSVSATDDNICKNEETTINVSSADTGIFYQLFDAGSDTAIGEAQEGAGVDLTFETGLLEETTTFYVSAEDPVSSCSGVLAEEATVTVSGPTETDLSAENESICEGESTNIVILSSETGVSYQLIDTSDNSPVGSSVTGTGADLSISTGALDSSISFSIEATDGNSCIANYGEVSITVNTLPNTDNMVSAEMNEVCVGSTINILISDSQAGITYQLYDAADDTPVGTSFEGNGSDLALATGAVGSAVTFYVNAFYSPDACEVTLDNTISLTVIDLPTASITYDENSFTLMATSADSYQWFLNGNSISGATSQTLQISQAGDYTVSIVLNGCTNTSEAFSVTVVGIDDLTFEDFNVYPNPSAGQINISMENLRAVYIYNSVGKLVGSESFARSGSSFNSMDISDNPPGLYILEIVSDSKTITKSIILN